MYHGYNGDPNILFSENNPFLELVATVGEGQPGKQLPEVPVAAPPPNMEHGAGCVKLPDFWPHAPGIWFARAELRFEVSGVVAERHKFAYTVDALPYEALSLVADLVEAPPADRPYTVLKERLLIAHQLTPMEKAIKLMELPGLGDRRPSQLLADLLQACPPGEQQTAFFRGAFVKRLPAELQAHLSGCESVDLKELAQRADQLWTTHCRPSPLATVAAGHCRRRRWRIRGGGLAGSGGAVQAEHQGEAGPEEEEAGDFLFPASQIWQGRSPVQQP
jgi:hypothetical protein